MVAFEGYGGGEAERAGGATAREWGVGARARGATKNTRPFDGPK